MTMSDLQSADYSRALAGKVIRTVHSSSDFEQHCMTIVFTDGTAVMFRLGLSVDEEVEIGDCAHGAISNERRLTATPMRAKLRPLEQGAEA